MKQTISRRTMSQKRTYSRVLLLVAGLGGLLYGIDVGIIAGALPYLEATSGLNAAALSNVVAAVLFGSVLSTLFAGGLADWMGRRNLMMVSGLLFDLSIPIIALAHGYEPLLLGRLLQGVSAGLIGIAVPLYLAECLPASIRGKGTGIFQWLLTLGIVVAAVLGIYFSARVQEVMGSGSAARLFAFKDEAWRAMFWASLPAGILFVIGCTIVSESPRWLYRRGKRDAALLALIRSRTPEQADVEILEMERTLRAEAEEQRSRGNSASSLLARKYVVPFLLACAILACNQATGINSVIAYNTTVLLQGGLSDLQAHWAYVLFTAVFFVATVGGVVLVDRIGRRALLSIGTAGMCFSLLIAGLLFLRTERTRVDCRDAVQALVTGRQAIALKYNPHLAEKLLRTTTDPPRWAGNRTTALTVVYSCGRFRTVTNAMRSDEAGVKPTLISHAGCTPADRWAALLWNPLGDFTAARRAPVKIDHALITPLPSRKTGLWIAATLLVFVVFYGLGPGVCVWLVLSELMPTRIRSHGMSIALVLNQAVATIVAAEFLPNAGEHGYAMIFFAFAGFSLLYFLVATLFVPETKGKTLEEIETAFH